MVANHQARIEAGLDCFDMADHYGDAGESCLSPEFLILRLLTRVELVMGQHNSSSTKEMIAFTKWCPPENGVTSFENAEKAVDLALKRMKQEKIELMQCRKVKKEILRGMLTRDRSCVGLYG